MNRRSPMYPPRSLQGKKVGKRKPVSGIVSWEFRFRVGVRKDNSPPRGVPVVKFGHGVTFSEVSFRHPRWMWSSLLMWLMWKEM